MAILKTIWSLLFRLFPCPVKTGVMKIGSPDKSSPVLVTCNFHLTVNRLVSILKKASIDAWLLIADSKGINVWCAAGAGEFNERAVISAVKTSGIGELVDHRSLILPALGGPGIRADDVSVETCWSVRWGPVRASDIPDYLRDGMIKNEKMKRVTYNLAERLDTALGSCFIFYLAGAAGLAFCFPSFLFDYITAGAAAFLIFFTLCPRLPGRRGIYKVSFLIFIFSLLLAFSEIISGPAVNPYRAVLIITMIMTLVYGLELGGLASNLPSDLDPFLARLGVSSIGSASFAGTVRTRLLNKELVLALNDEICIGCGSCEDICPQGVWEKKENEEKAKLKNTRLCTACRACLVQCPTGAIQALEIGEAG